MKSASDQGRGVNSASVVRYLAAVRIRKMMDASQYPEAFVHSQLAMEKVLWDKIVGVFSGEKAMKVRKAIDDWGRDDRSRITKTFELIKWAHILGAIDANDLSDLTDFNRKRNNLLHGHGQWWFPQEYKQALEKGIRFLERNGY